MSDHKNDLLGNRMKRYEDVYRIRLPEKLSIIMRLDGVAFHTLCRGLKRPIDENLVSCMNDTAIYLCNKIQGVKVAYLQSDEISLLIYNKDFDVQPWFDNNLQKMVSVSAAKASSYFSSISHRIFGTNRTVEFDSRVMIYPEMEICNYFIFRQQDATRNSIQSLARSLYSHKEVFKKNNPQLQELCWQKGINWNDCPTSHKRGRCIVKIPTNYQTVNRSGQPINIIRYKWKVDNEIPIFSKDRNYIDQYL